MTFLSITPDTFDAIAAEARPAVLRQQPRASLMAHLTAALIVSAGVMLPGAVAEAKWSKLCLILTNVQHRCLAAVSA